MTEQAFVSAAWRQRCEGSSSLVDSRSFLLLHRDFRPCLASFGVSEALSRGRLRRSTDEVRANGERVDLKGAGGGGEGHSS